MRGSWITVGWSKVIPGQAVRFLGGVIVCVCELFGSDDRF